MKLAVICVTLCCLFAFVHSVCIDSQGQAVLEGGGPFIGPDHCNSCMCQDGHAVCTTMFCSFGHYRCMGPDHRIYVEGQSFQAADGCNICTCMENGSVSCTEMACTGK